MTTKKVLSDRQYITRSGFACPVCHSQINRYDGEFRQLEDPLHVERRVTCGNHKCGAAWLEVFELKRIDAIQDRDRNIIERG
jgi:hypothetical protein